MDHFRNTLGPARRPASARLTNSIVPLRTPQLRFILDSSVGIVTGPHAGDRGIGVQFSTPAEIVFSLQRPKKIFALPTPLSSGHGVLCLWRWATGVMPRGWMCGVMSPPPRTSSWYGTRSLPSDCINPKYTPPHSSWCRWCEFEDHNLHFPFMACCHRHDWCSPLFERTEIGVCYGDRWSVPITGPVVALRVGRGIALLFHDRGTRRGWVVSSTPRPTLPPGKTRYPLYRRLGGTQGRSKRAENLAPPVFDPRNVLPEIRKVPVGIHLRPWAKSAVTQSNLRNSKKKFDKFLPKKSPLPNFVTGLQTALSL